MNVSKFHKKLEDNGFVIIKNFFPKELCREIKNFSKKLKPKVNMPFSNITWGYGNLTNVGPLKKINSNERLNNIIRSILKSDYVFNHTMIANKSKWIGPDVEFHQEIFNVNTFAPGADPKKDWKKILQIYIAIDNQKEASGSLRIIPSSHKLGQLKHEDCVNSFLNHKRRVITKDLSMAYEKYGILNMSLKSGDLLIFNTRLVHGSPSNASNDDRMAIVSQVRSSKIKLNKKIFKKETNYRRKVVENYLLKKISILKKKNNYSDFRKEK
tara:strand:- start:311 stop:1117 length:807 start_codon:yes stop_codon:yes gene_type:complete